MDLIGYIRVSRVAGREGDSFISPSVQRERVQAYADAHQHRIVDWVEELDQSGGKMDRPGLVEAINRCERGEAKGIIVAKLDRFSRSLAGALAAIEQLQAAGCQLISVADNIDSSTPTGRLMRDFMLSIAQWYRETVAESWNTSRSRAIQRGVHISSHPPTGYKRGARGLEVDKKAAAAIRDAFHMRARGETLAEIARMLDTRRVRGSATKNQACWTAGSVQKILRNRAYLGEARSGEYLNRDAHPAILSAAEYEAAQHVRSHPSTKSGPGQLLSGLVRCAGCRYCLQADAQTDRGTRRRTYRCRKDRHASGVCPAPVTVLASVVEPYVVEAFLSALDDGFVAGLAGGDPSAILAAEEQLADAEAELAAWVDTVKITDVGAQVYADGLRTRQAQVDTARAALGDTARGSGSTPPQDLRDAWPSLTTGEQHALMSSAIDCVFLRRGRGPIETRAVILWRGEAPEDLPTRGRLVPLASYAWPEEHPAASVPAA